MAIWTRTGFFALRMLSRPAAAAFLAGGAGLAALLAATRQFGLAGAARELKLVPNQFLAFTPTYGGNHALLAGGEATPFPNWVQLNDWGVLFWPGVVLVMFAGITRRDGLLFTGGVTGFLTGVFWHLFTISYVTETPTDLRVQMYRYASMATAIAAPWVPCAVAVLTPARLYAARAVLLSALVLVSGGAGIYFTAGASRLTAETGAEWAGDAALARELAREPAGARLAMLGGATSFVEMYNTDRGGYLPLWWVLGGASVPVGWDFGHPEYYEPLYRRVVQNFDSHAAAELQLTHVALAPGQLAPDDREPVSRFLERCAAQERASWGPAGSSTSRVLYAIHADACAGETRR